MNYDLFPLFVLVWLLPAVAFVPATFFAHMALQEGSDSARQSVLIQAHPMYFLAQRAGRLTNARWLGLWLVIACFPGLNFLLAPVFVGLYFHQAMSRKVMRVNAFLDSIWPAFL